MRYAGEYGGRVLRAFKADAPFIVGAFIEPEKAMSWPLANRKALENQHKVEWYGPPVDEVPQKPAPTRTKKDEEKEEKKKEKEAVKETKSDEKKEDNATEKKAKTSRTKGSRRKK